MSRHLPIHVISLYSGGDLPWWNRFTAGRHIRSCEACSAELRAFAEARGDLREQSEGLPADVNWNRLAAEMKANIHLGLEAGEIAAGRMSMAECQDEYAEEPAYRAFFKPMAALASVAVFLYGATWMLSKRSANREVASAQILLTTTAEGIEYQGNGSALTLLQGGAKPVAFKVGAGSGLRAQYVDEETGQVTINHVYTDQID